MEVKSDEWLKTLKEGDLIFLEVGSFGPNLLYPDKVKRITKTMIILEKSSSRFRLNGNMIDRGSYSHGSWLNPDNEKTREEYWKQGERQKMKSLLLALENRPNINALTHEQLERLVPALVAIKEELIPTKKEV
jgi:hypothetical protein